MNESEISIGTKSNNGDLRGRINGLTRQRVGLGAVGARCHNPRMAFRTPFSLPSWPPLGPGLAGWRLLVEEQARHRLVLLINHVLSSEPLAQQRLLPHVGRSLQVRAVGWPSLLAPVLPAPQPLRLAITPAGLLELADGAVPELADDLVVDLDTRDPVSLAAQLLGGGVPSVQLQGDARLAADVGWLAENLRWDVAADVERLVGPIPAERLRLWGLMVASALRQGLTRWVRPRPPAP